MNSEYFKTQFKDCPVVYIESINANLKNHKTFTRLLEILGIDVNRLQPIKQPTQFDKIIVPDGSWMEGFTNDYRDTIDRLRSFAMKNRTPTSCKKIYYFHGRSRQVGEERLSEYFKSKGYEIFSPEKLTFDEQLNLLINAELFASTIGSCSHNSIFMRDHTEAIFIPRAPETNHVRAYASYLNGIQRSFNQHNALNAIYIDSALSVFHFPCYVISKQLKSFFGDKWDGYEEEDFKTFLQYVKMCLNEGMVLQPEYLEAYRRILPDFMEQLEQREDLIKAYNMPKDWERAKLILLESMVYQTQVHRRGWYPWTRENQISNPIEDKLDVQTIKIDFPRHKVYYSVYYNDKEGWSEEVLSPEMAGTTGQAKPIYGMRVRLDESGSKKFDILYRMHKFDGTWTPWAKNGEALYSYGQRLNAIQIKLEAKMVQKF